MEGLGPLLDTDPDQFLEMYRINVLGPLILVQTLADALVRCGGSVVNIGSVGVYGLPFHGAYASSKVSHYAHVSTCSIYNTLDTDHNWSRRPCRR